MSDKIRVGTRPSPLALKQVDEMQARLPDVILQKVPIRTQGDKDKLTPLYGVEGTDFFTQEIDEALLAGDIDCAVHSAKDVPIPLREGLAVAAITECLSPHDALVSRFGLKLEELPLHAVIGVSSERRKQGLLRFREDFCLMDIRGNINERLLRLDKGEFDGIIVAVCALMRLDLTERITQIIPDTIIEPHPLQGSLALVARVNDSKIREIFRVLDNRKRIYGI